jgi:hypothetical protein
MPVALPFVTRQEIVREFRPDETITAATALRSLKLRKALSPGFSIEARAGAGRLGGRTHLYSALNRDAARAARRKDFPMAARLCKAAARLDVSPEAKRLAKALAAGGALTGTAELARALSLPSLTTDVMRLQRKVEAARRSIEPSDMPTIQSGRVTDLSEIAATVALEGLGTAFPVPRAMIEAIGAGSIGAAVSASWELLPGGRTIMTVEPAIDAPEVNDLNEPLVDLYGTPWGRLLTGVAPGVVKVTGTPTIEIPAGIPDVE